MRVTRYTDVSDNLGECIDLPWDELAERLSRHVEGPKDGVVYAFATFEGTRVYEHLRTRTAIALDIETSKTTGEIPPDPEQMIETLRGIGAAAVLWTTFGHTTRDPRYRVVLPHDEADLSDDARMMLDNYLVPSVAQRLGVLGVTDRSKFGATSLYFPPRTLASRMPMARSAVIEGPLVNLNSVYRLAVAMMVAEETEQRAALQKSVQLDPAAKALVESYNAENEIGDLLTMYGYKRRGRRWKSPHQSRDSAPSTEIKHDGQRQWWGSFSETDAQVGVGQRPKKASQLLCFGDAFSLFTFYECNGSFKDALAAIRRRRHNQPSEGLRDADQRGRTDGA